MNVDVTNFVLCGDCFGKALVAGEGHWHIFVDQVDMAHMKIMGGGPSQTAALKGGTALSKIYFPGRWRLSEDLDFTVVGGGPEAPEALQPIFAPIGEWMREQSGIDPAQDRSRLDLLGEFCASLELDPDALVAACLLKKEGRETKISIKGRRSMAERIAE